MKRNMDFVRELLLVLEKAQSPVALTDTGKDAANIGIEADPYEFRHHFSILEDAELIKVRRVYDEKDVFQPGHEETFAIRFYVRLTWQGHEFLDAVRDPEIWRKTKGGVEEAKGFTFDLLKDLARGLIKKQIEEYTGVIL